ncbi:MAG: hypothetical protein JW699_07415 [Chitinispirillaceae bacterium]|nr:hypothetical protein [Chitinispirillaceae bacterium]
MAIDTKEIASVRHAKRLRIILLAVMLAMLYVPSRLFVLNSVRPAGTDTDLYARYAYIRRLASERRVSFHELYRDRGHAVLESGGPRPFDSLILTVVAYPPLAVAVMTIPALLMQGGTADAEAFTREYARAFRRLCAVAEAVAAAAVFLLMLVLYGNDKTITLVFRISVLCLAGMLMPRILYDRLDVILGALLALSLVFLVRKATILSFFVFALAVNFKLIPVFLFPVWVAGSLSASDCDGPSLRARAVRVVRKSITRGAVLFLFIAGVALVFYAAEGRGAFDYLRFHLERGVHIESFWGALSLLAARLSGAFPVMVLTSGAYNVSAPTLAALSFPFMAGLLTIATIIIFAGAVLGRREPACLPHPGAVVEASLLFLCIVLTFSPVFSPQYLLALIPLAALLPYTGGGAFIVSCVFIGVCGLSTLIYPYFYSSAILTGPSWFGLFLLNARMLLLLGMTVFLFSRISGRLSGARAGAGGPDRGRLFDR